MCFGVWLFEFMFSESSIVSKMVVESDVNWGKAKGSIRSFVNARDIKFQCARVVYGVEKQNLMGNIGEISEKLSLPGASSC